MDLKMMFRKTLMSMVAMATFASVPAHAGDPASAATKAAQSALAKTLPFADRQDFDFASRGYLGTRSDPISSTPPRMRTRVTSCPSGARMRS